jgi:hypothetical protein
MNSGNSFLRMAGRKLAFVAVFAGWALTVKLLRLGTVGQVLTLLLAYSHIFPENRRFLLRLLRVLRGSAKDRTYPSD